MIICFGVGPTLEADEFERQMELQEKALNNMSPEEMLANKARYDANPEAMRKLSDPLQEKCRTEYATSDKVNAYWKALHPFDWEEKRDEYIANGEALHNADMIAGGRYDSVVDKSMDVQDRFGGLKENSSMGSQWRWGRAERLKAHAIKQAENGCPNVNVDLRVCQSMTGVNGMPKDRSEYVDF